MFKKIENLIVILVAISAIATLLYNTSTRELTIRPSSEWITLTADDRNDGGKSSATSQSTDKSFAFDYEIREGFANPYASVIIRPSDENRLLDLRGMESVSVTAHIEGKERDNYRLQLRNRDLEFYKPDDFVSLRYNEVCMQLTNQPTTQTIPLDNFYVPAWWIGRMSVPVDKSKPVFDSIEWIEINTSSVPDKGHCRVVIDEIKFSGHWISANLFHQIMFGMWMCFGTLVALSQIVGLRESLTQSKSEQITLKHQAAKLEELATLDPLTQLYNRRGMRPHATEAMQKLRQLGSSLSLIMFDIDNFKALNDEYGHCYGDGILKHVAAVVSERLSENEPLARWGGEEFLVVCKDSELDKASQLAQQLRKTVEEEVKVTCSFGVLQLNSTVEFSEALDLVDHCLYEAKNAGRNCVKASHADRCENLELVEKSTIN